MSRYLVLLVALSAVLAGSARGANPAIKEKVQRAWQAAGLPLHVPMGRTLELTAPGIPGRAGQLVVLCLQARLDCPGRRPSFAGRS